MGETKEAAIRSGELKKTRLQCDGNVKKFLSQKIILAHILAYSVEEFAKMEPKNIVPLIGDSEVSSIPVDDWGR